jgi:hypothetical protein
LLAHRPAFPKHPLKGQLNELHGGRMRARLGLSRDHLAPKQLDWLVLIEEAQIDQPIVFGPCPVTGAGRPAPGAMWMSWLPAMGRACQPAKLPSMRMGLSTGSVSLLDARPLTSR